MAAIVISTYTNQSSIGENLANSHTMLAGNLLLGQSMSFSSSQLPAAVCMSEA